jgi:hypothetical protein
MHAETVRAMRSRLVARFRSAGHTVPLEGDAWRRFPRPRFPQTPDGGVLFQDPHNTAERIASLGPYARPVVVRGKDAMRLLSPELESDLNGEG